MAIVSGGPKGSPHIKLDAFRATRAKANGEVFEDTRARGKPVVVFTGSRPFTGGLCEGVEIAMESMRAGGRRLIKVKCLSRMQI
eukprot:1138919-Pelagomonas_calceolata.AAC.2